jgi:hypothetical protein
MSQTGLGFLFLPPVLHASKVFGVLTETLSVIPLHESGVAESVRTQCATERPIPENNLKIIKSGPTKLLEKE